MQSRLVYLVVYDMDYDGKSTEYVCEGDWDATRIADYLNGDDAGSRMGVYRVEPHSTVTLEDVKKEYEED